MITNLFNKSEVAKSLTINEQGEGTDLINVTSIDNVENGKYGILLTVTIYCEVERDSFDAKLILKEDGAHFAY